MATAYPLKNDTAHTQFFLGVNLSILADHVSKAAIIALFGSLAVIYFWFGGMKFTAYEAEGLVGLVSNSPLLSWFYTIMSVSGFSAFLGVLEIAIGLLILARFYNPKFSAIGGLLSMGLFFTTLSFMFTTPGVIVTDLGFPAISVAPGQFLLKDIGLFAASLFIVGNSLSAMAKAK